MKLVYERSLLRSWRFPMRMKTHRMIIVSSTMSCICLITTLIAEATEPAFVAFALLFRGAISMSTWFSAIAGLFVLKMMANFHFTMVSGESLRASTFVIPIALSTVHTRDHAFCCNFYNINFNSFFQFLLTIHFSSFWPKARRKQLTKYNEDLQNSHRGP